MRREEPTAIVSLGSAWAGNSVNCVPFRISGMLSRGGIRYASFYDSNGDVVVTSLVATSPPRALSSPMRASRSTPMS